MDPLVSVILPTYNVEKYIDTCIESILKQTYKKIEIIIVVDGATDNSYTIAERWKNTDARVRVYWQKNAGSGVARNNGLSHANGELIMFIDPDDWIDEQMIEVYIEAYKKSNSDIIISGYVEEYKSGGKVKSSIKSFQPLLVQGVKEVRAHYIELYLSEIVCAPTRILYKKSIIDTNRIKFPDLRRSQDIVFNYRYYNCIKSIEVLEGAYYHYRVDAENYVKKLKEDYYKIICQMYSDIIEMHKQ